MKSKVDRVQEALARFYESAAVFIIEKKWLFISFIILFTFFMAMQIPKIRADFANEAFFKKTDPEVLKYQEMKKTFGNDEFVYILFEVQDFFKPEVIAKTRKFQEEIKNIKYKDKYVITEVESLVNARYIEGKAGELSVSALIPDNPDSDTLKEIKAKALKDEIFLDNFISQDGKHVGILASVMDIPGDGEFRKVITREMRNIFKKPEYGEFQFHAVGIPIFDHDSDVITGEESVIFLMVSLVVVTVILLWLFKSFMMIIGSLLDVLLSTFYVYCFMGILNMPITLMTIPIPLLIIVIGVGDSIHVVSKYSLKYPSFNDKKAALKVVYREIGFPCLFTNITTMIGFLSLTTNEIVPIKHLGIVCAIAVFFSHFHTMTLVPILLPKIKRKIKTAKKTVMMDKILDKIAVFNEKRKIAIVAVSIVVLIISFFGLARLQIDTNFLNDFRENATLVKDYKYVDKQMGGTLSLDMVLSQPGGKDVRDPQFLGETERIIHYLEDQKKITAKVFSINHIVKRIHKELNEGQSQFYKIPDRADVIKQELFLYSLSDQENLAKFLDFDNKQIRVTVRTRNQSSRHYTRFLQELGDFIKTQTPGVRVVLTGGLSQMMRMAEYVSQGQVSSYGTALFLICLAMVFVFLSIKIGIVAMIPNVIPVVFTVGLMGFIQMPLDFFTLLVACITIGIIVDDTIHLISEARLKYSESGDYSTSVKEALKDDGRAVISSSLALGFGFLICIFSQSLGVAQFGLICAITIFSALVFELFLTPALILIIKPFKKIAPHE